MLDGSKLKHQNTVYTPHTLFQMWVTSLKKFTAIFEHSILLSLISVLYLCNSLNFPEILVEFKLLFVFSVLKIQLKKSDDTKESDDDDHDDD